MSFKTELHCHTREISPCSSESPEQVAQKYIDNGYTTLVITNHASKWIFEAVLDSKNNPWETQVERYFDAVDHVREAAGGKLNVLYGMEIRFPEADNDYLVFGITREFCLGHPDLFAMDHRSFHELAKENGLLFIQAHPMRFGMKTISPDNVDGYEIFNGHPNQRSHNGIAEAWAKHFTRHELIFTSGTDNHDGYMIPDGGIVTDAPITSSDELLSVLRSGEYEIIRSPLGDAEY